MRCGAYLKHWGGFRESIPGPEQSNQSHVLIRHKKRNFRMMLWNGTNCTYPPKQSCFRQDIDAYI